MSKKILRKTGLGEHTIVFLDGVSGGGDFTVHTRHRMTDREREELQNDIRGISYCFDLDNNYGSSIYVGGAFKDEDILQEVADWVAAWLRRKHPQTVMHKICSAFCCPFRCRS